MVADTVFTTPEAAASSCAFQPVIKMLSHSRLYEVASERLNQPELVLHARKAMQAITVLFQDGSAASSVRKYATAASASAFAAPVIDGLHPGWHVLVQLQDLCSHHKACLVNKCMVLPA